MSNKLTPNQEQIYQFIKAYIAQNRRSPYLREIQQACSISSHKSVIDRLIALERKGYVKRKLNQHRSIRLVNNNSFHKEEASNKKGAPEVIQNKRILVTGGGGFIGSHLARELYGRGNFVRVVDIKWNGYIREPYYSEKLTLDLRRWENCLAATEGMDYVFNLAANMGGIGFITEVGADIMHDNVLINVFIAKSCLENKVKRLFFSSSACIYPTYRQEVTDIQPLKEEDAYPADPDNFYGWEKLFSEKVLEAFNKDYGLDIRIARYHNVYGPEGTYDGGREKSPAALCRKVAQASDIGEIEIWGDGKQRRSYCYIDDCLRGTIALMESDYNKPLNIGSDRLVTIDQFADIIIKISGKKITKKYNLSAAQGVRGRNADLTLVKKVLGWQPEVSLEEGLKKTYNWIEKTLSKQTVGL